MMFALMQSAQLESLHLSVDPATGLKAVIAIHNTRLGPALGGVVILLTPMTKVRLAMPSAWRKT